MNRTLKVALLCGLALTVASCGTVRNALPFGLGGAKEDVAKASDGQRISVLEFEQQLAPSAGTRQGLRLFPNPGHAHAAEIRSRMR